MARPRLPFRRLLPAAMMRAAAGLAVIAALTATGLIAPQWGFAGAGVCLALAFLFAVPAARDLAALADYGEGLARQGEAESPNLSGWAPAQELAATMRRIARESRRREQDQRATMVASQLVFDSLPQALLLLDDARHVLRVNAFARELIGMDPVGADLSAAFRDPRVLTATDEVLRTKEQRAVSLAVPDPVDRFFQVEIVPFAQPTADGATVLVALYDLTERRRAEQMRADFVANASHELRTPLATLIGFIETLRGPARDDRAAQEKFLALMHEQAARMSRLVQDLLSLSAIELVEHTPPDAPASIAEIVRSVTAALQLAADKKHMKIRTEIAGDLNPVAGDADQLAQLFQNLVDNAIKYGRKGTEIRVAVRRADQPPPALARAVRERAAPGVVWISVTDQGEVIPAEHIPRLTERFYRVDTARSRAVGGTGLGLAIVKHIVNRHRGLLEIASEEDVGSTFSVCLPELPAGGTAPDTTAPAA